MKNLIALLLLVFAASHASAATHSPQAVPHASAQPAAHAKMKNCQARASKKKLKGNARQTFIRACVKKGRR